MNEFSEIAECENCGVLFNYRKHAKLHEIDEYYGDEYRVSCPCCKRVHYWHTRARYNDNTNLYILDEKKE